MIDPLKDILSRPLRDLRISVTDRCNFRCTYCMPKELFGRDYHFLPKSEILSFEEITRLSQIFITLGVEKLRLTGGEPLLRKNLPELISMLHGLEGLRDLTLTTNGSLLASQAAALRNAGLQRLTVSLDSLDETRFAAMNDVDFPLSRVLAGINAAVSAGFSPIKINVVVKRGVNEPDVAAIARRFSGKEYIVRYIEFMDVGNSNGWRLDDVVPADEILQLLHSNSPIETLPPNYPGEVARRFRHPDGGEIGIISSVSQPFCGDCSRARLSADGHLYTCLFSGKGHDLQTPMRAGASDSELTEIISRIWRARTDRYSEIRSDQTNRAPRPKAEMSLLGG
ncbi:MAG: molybdenum cofactor biosynthesis protein MoeA [Chthoniobacteraceae bacterium]|nr:molybdenum cofactor biosynthesis protein MoeA [Chthoniobacteraceae bacterium]